MKIVLLFFSLVIISCNKLQTETDKISIDKNWEIEGLKLNQSTIKDFENFSKTKHITFEKDSIQNNYQKNDTLEYCGNDYNLYTITYKFSNKSLGLDLYFEKNNFYDSTSFKKYEVSKLDQVNFQNDFSRIISKSELNKAFKYDKNTNSYLGKFNQKYVSLKVNTLDKETYEIKALKVYYK